MLLFSFVLSPTASFAKADSPQKAAPEVKTQSPTKVPAPQKGEKQDASGGMKAPTIVPSGPMSLSAVVDEQLPYYLRDSGADEGRSDKSSASGAFTYDYPITVPPGRNGMEPNLKLSYSSQSKDEGSPFGYGWDISIPYIERYNVEGLEDLYSTTSPHFYSSLSGELATTSNAAVFYSRSDDGSYMEYAFASNAWIVTDKNGMTYKYGTAAGSRQDNPSDSSKAYRWYLEETKDTNGNTVNYTYSKDLGQVYPASINYTGTNGTGGIFAVDFTKDLRATSTATTTKSGFGVKTRYKISQVKTSVNGGWVRSYDFSYTHGDNGSRLMLASVTESGRDEASTTAAFLPTTFSYATSTSEWTESAVTAPTPFVNDEYDYYGITLADVNGDALTDILRSFKDVSGTTKIGYINNGSGWTQNATWAPPCVVTELFASSQRDLGTRVTDVNGDSLPDFICNSTVLLNTGNGWATSSAWTNPVTIIDSYKDVGTRFADLNGDGLIDIVRSYETNPNSPPVTITKQVYINNGHGWTLDTGWTIPTIFTSAIKSDTGARIADVNADGLDDIISGHDSSYGPADIVYMNTGSTWATSTTWTVPIPPGRDTSVRLADLNNDGLVDIGLAAWLEDNTPSSHWVENDVYLNTGTEWVIAPGRELDAPFSANSVEVGSRTVEVDGDGTMDVIVSGVMNEGGYLHTYNDVYLGTGVVPDLLTLVREQGGATVVPTYKASAFYRDSSNAMLNPTFPANLMTVNTVSKFDGIAATTTNTYTYSNGSNYYANPFDHRLAGFGTTTQTDSGGNVITSYFHQGNTTATSSGEYADDQSKIGKMFRSEAYDNSGHLYALGVNTWQTYNRVGKANFVKKTQSTKLSYDGDSDHADKAETYTYDDSTGNLTQKVEWGKVTGSSDGSFSDTGSDKFTTNLSYAASSTVPFALQSQETVLNQSNTTIRETKNYYDTLSFGSINKGNLTKQESWVTGSSTIDVEKTYDSRGLVLTEKDPRDKQTTYTYDSYNLYRATTTNPLSQTVSSTFDYSSGKPLRTVNANGRAFETAYDPFDRVKEEKQPDSVTPSTLVTKATYTYTDTSMPRRVASTKYLDATTTAESFTYSDGLGRKVQELSEAEGSNTYAAKTYVYDTRGLLESESLPYFVYTSSYTGTSSAPALYLLQSYTYDPLQRKTIASNSVGNTTYAFDDWVTTVTDAGGTQLDLTKDAYDNLIIVVEHNGVSAYTSAYEYNGNKKLTKITDADANVRNFTYDSLGRRITAQDIHDGADGTYGTWSYAYDASSNLASTTDPKSQVVSYTYDDLNRVLTEDYAGTGGTEVSYAYDACTDGKGQLCSATSTSAVATFLYDPLGRVATEARSISSTTATTLYEYDRAGNPVYTTYPDSSQVRYLYNSAGMLESVAQKESGGSFSNVIADFDYAPTGKVKYKEFGNGAVSTYSYSAGKLYRLTNIRTSLTGQVGMQMMMGGGGGEEDEGQFEDFEELSILKGGHLALASNDPYLLSLLNIVQAEPVLPSQQEIIEESVEPVQPEVPTETNNEPIPPVEEKPVPEEPPIEIPEVTPPVVDEPVVPVVEPAAPETVPAEEKTSTTTDEMSPVQDRAEYLKSLPVDAEELKFKAPLDRHLGSKEIKEGIIKYAYKSDQRVDSLPVGVDTNRKAQEAGLTITGEVSDKRTSHSRTFATNEPGAFIAEIISGDPQYYEDEKGEWWIADYGITTKASYEYQKEVTAKEEKPTIIEMILSFFLPKHALAASVTFYPDPNTEVTSVDGSMEKNDSSNWTTTRNASASNAGDDLSAHLYARDEEKSNGKVGLARAFLLFDTSVLPDAAIVTAATVNMYITNVLAGSSEKRIYAVAATPASNTALVLGDYDQVGSTSFGTTDGTYTLNTYESLSLNSTGLAAITPTGVSKLGFRSYNDFNNNWTTDAIELTVVFASAETTGTSQDPNLVVIYNLAPTEPTSLQTESRTNPNDVTDPTPEFSAIYGDSDAGDVALNYLIQVSTSTSFTSPYWDSGKTALSSSTPVGSRTPDISYSGSTLASSTPYYWRVKFWDTADSAGSWSSNATFTISQYAPPGPPTSLETNAQTNPTNLTDNTPEFSAIHHDIDSGDLALYYQIQVATSSSFTSPYWDSGKTPLASSTPNNMRTEVLPYVGPALVPGTTYYWRIKYWDTHTFAGEWSVETATFSTGALSTSDIVQDTYYFYDNVGNITAIKDYSGTQAARQVTYVYDGLNRLTSASTTAASSTPYLQTYAYSPIGNITSKSDQGSYTYGETGYTNPHAATSIASTSLAYDTNGNLTAYGAKNYAWDYRNRMTASQSGGATTTYAYDHTNQRVLKVAAGTTTRYVNRLYDTTGTTTSKRIYAGGELIATVETAGATSTIQYIHPDHLGSTNVASNNAGAASEVTDYYPYGGERAQSGSFEEKRGYIGELHDDESDLSYLNARYYDGGRGGFLSQDPSFLALGDPNKVQALTSLDHNQLLMSPQSLNSYSYAENNPITKKDPTGNTSIMSHALGGPRNPNIPVSANNYKQNVMTQGLKVGFGLPVATMQVAGLVGAAVATAQEAVVAGAYASAAVGAASRATGDAYNGTKSTAGQYGTSAAADAIAGAASVNATIGRIVFNAGASAAAQNMLDSGNVGAGQAGISAIGAAGAKMAGQSVESSLGRSSASFMPAFAENLINYSVSTGLRIFAR